MRTITRILLLAILCLTPAVWAAPSEAAPAGDRHMQAARTFWSLITMRLRSGRPGERLLQTSRTLCQSEHRYCYEHAEHEKIGDTPSRVEWQASVDFNPKWRGVKTYPLSDKMKAARIADDPDTGALVFYRVRKNRKGERFGSVDFRMVRDDVRLTLTVTRPVAVEGKHAAVRRALGRWRFFVRAAIHFRIFGERPIRIVPQLGSLSGRALVSGQVIRHDTSYEAPTPLPLVVAARPEGLERGEPYEVRIELRPEARRFMRVAGPGVSLVKGLYVLRTDKEQVEIELQFDPKALSHHRVPAGRLKFSQASRTKEIAVDVHDWQPIITRFDVSSPVGARPRVDAKDGTPTFGDGRETFGATYENLGDLFDTWTAFRRVVRPRQFGDSFFSGDTVVNGWRRGFAERAVDPSEWTQRPKVEDPNGFYFAEQTGGEHNAHGTFKRGSRLTINIDLLVVDRTEIARGDGEPKFGDDDFDDDVFAGSLANALNTVITNEQRIKNRKRVAFTDFRLSIHEVDPAAEDWRADAKPKEVRAWAFQQGGDVDQHLPLPFEMVEGRKDAVKRPSRFHWDARKPGIFEIRLMAEMVRKVEDEAYGNDRDVRRKLAVAIRVRILPASFDERLIHWTEERYLPAAGR